jgi:putative pyrroloquinoline-quinone binding quinoprotein
VIDLDLLVPEAIPEPWPVNLRRRWLTVGTLLLVLLLASGATVPGRPGLPLVRTATLVNTATYRILGDALYIAESRPDGNWLTAYPLAPGPPRWAARVSVLADAVGMEVIGDVLVISMAEPDVSGDHTIGLDRRTGALRWHSPLILAAIDWLRGRVVLTEYLATGLGGGPPPARIAVLTAATGTLAWSYVRQAACEADVPYRVTQPGTGVAVLCRDGSLTVLDLATGQVRARATVAGTGRVIDLSDQLVISSGGFGGHTTLTSYAGADLRSQWTSTVDGANFGVFNCGPRICLDSSTAEVVLDRDTGAVVWAARPVGFATTLTDRYVLVAPVVLGDVELVDVTDGRVIMQLGSWTVENGPVGPLMFYQSDGATGRTWLARLDLGGTGMEVIGFVPYARAETCASAGGYVVCRTVNSTVSVWRYQAG